MAPVHDRQTDHEKTLQMTISLQGENPNPDKDNTPRSMGLLPPRYKNSVTINIQ